MKFGRVLSMKCLDGSAIHATDNTCCKFRRSQVEKARKAKRKRELKQVPGPAVVPRAAAVKAKPTAKSTSAKVEREQSKGRNRLDHKMNPLPRKVALFILADDGEENDVTTMVYLGYDEERKRYGPVYKKRQTFLIRRHTFLKNTQIFLSRQKSLRMFRRVFAKDHVGLIAQCAFQWVLRCGLPWATGKGLRT